jgi:general secretion pathway protein I
MTRATIGRRHRHGCGCPQRTPTTARGFTLVEVLVAVAIVALAITGILTAMMRQVDGTAYLRDKLFADYVALNRMELALLANASTNQLPSDKDSGNEEMAGRTWYWRTVPKKTAQPGTAQLEIAVAAEDGKDAPALATLTVILDTFHRLPQ